MKNITLAQFNYMLNDGLEQVKDIASRDDGMINEDWFNTINEIEMVRNEKVLNISAFIRNCENEIVSNNEKNLKLEKKVKDLKKYLKIHIKEGESFHDGSGKIVLGWHIHKTIVIDEPDKVPEKYIDTTKTVNLTKLKKLIKSGGETNYAHLETKNNIHIY